MKIPLKLYDKFRDWKALKALNEIIPASAYQAAKNKLGKYYDNAVKSVEASYQSTLKTLDDACSKVTDSEYWKKWFGDKGIKVSSRYTPSSIASKLGFDINDVSKVPNSNRVYKPNGRTDNPTEEIRFSDEIANGENEDIVLSLTKNQPGIDGFFKATGKPLQLKTITSANTTKIAEHAKSTYNKAKEYGFDGTELRMEAKNMSIQDVLSTWNNKTRVPSYNYPNDGTIAGIKVYCSNGIVTLPL